MELSWLTSRYWLKRWVARMRGGSNSARRRPPGRRLPRLEGLEDRLVPAVGLHTHNLAMAPLATVTADPTPDPGPPPGTPPPVSPGNGEVAGVPLPSGGSLYYAEDAKLDGFAWFDTLHGWFPDVLHSANSVSPGHRVVDMAYADQGSMTFLNVNVAAAECSRRLPPATNASKRPTEARRRAPSRQPCRPGSGIRGGCHHLR